MIDQRQHLASVTSILGSLIAVGGVTEAEPWLTLFGIGCSAVSAAAALVPLRDKRKANLSAHIEGLNLDSLHVANLRRRLNKSLCVQRAFHVAIIDGPDLHIAWQYDGLCNAERETGIDFSIDSENNVPFQRLECFAFDLGNDPERLHPIRPTLVGSDGVSKKVNVRFLRALKKNERFSMLLNCALPECVSTGLQYYTSSLSFGQPAIESASVHLIFVRAKPAWVKVYELDNKQRATFVSEIPPFRDDGLTCEYVDIAQNVRGQSVRVYLYNLPVLGVRTGDAQESTVSPLFSRN